MLSSSDMSDKGSLAMTYRDARNKTLFSPTMESNIVNCKKTLAAMWVRRETRFFLHLICVKIGVVSLGKLSHK